jgi:predicted transcriptional regulator
LAPIKVSLETDQRIGHAAHFLNLSKKEVVDQAVAEFIDHRRAEIDQGVRLALAQLGGGEAAAVSLLTGLDADRIERLGGTRADG